MYNKDNNIQIGLANNNVFSARVKNPINAQIGEIVSLNKSDLTNMKTENADSSYLVSQEDKDKYEGLLRNLNMPENEDNIYAIKALEKNNVKVTKDNIQSFDFSKKCLSNIIQNIDYDKVVKLTESDVDVENDSLQKISDEIDKAQEEDDGSIFKNIFSKKELTTEEASEIAEKIYGSPMGKDITDIIKSLYKEGITITKSSVEKIYDVFYKLNNLKDAPDKTFVDTIKNNVVASIDNMYKIKNFVKSSVIEPAIGNAKSYINLAQNIPMKDIDVSKLKQDIVSALKDMNMADSDENIEIAKELIKNNVSVDKENIDKVLTIKNSLKNVSENMDYATAGQMIKNIDISKESIDKLDMSITNLKSSKINYSNPKDLGFLKDVNTDVIAYQIKNEIPLDIKNLRNTYKAYMSGDIKFKNIPPSNENIIKDFASKNINNFDIKDKTTDDLIRVTKSAVANDFEITKSNLEKTYKSYINLKNIRENLNKDILAKITDENIDIEQTHIKDVSNYIDKYNLQKMKYKDLIDKVSTLKEKDFYIANLMKNEKDITLKEIEKLSSFVKNKDQLGHKIENIYLDLSNNESSKEDSENMKKSIKEMMQKMKESSMDIDDYYDGIKHELENIKSGSIESVINNINKKCDDGLDILQNILKDNSDEKMLQIPILLNDKFANLNMYYREKKHATSKQMKTDTDVILSLETPNLGMVNMHFNLKDDDIKIRFDIDNENAKRYIKNSSNELENLLSEIGINTKEIEFDKKKANIFEDVSCDMAQIESSSYLDMKI